MNRPRVHTPPLWPYIWLLAALVASGVLWATHPWGVGIDGDSVGYLRAARALAEGHGLEGYSSLYPPLFPLMLAPFPLLGIDPATGGRYLEAVLLAAILVAAWQWLGSTLRTRTAAFFGLLALAASSALVEAAGLLLTEIPFILVTTLGLLAADRYWREGSGPWLLALALCCAVSGALRYAGVVLGMAGGLLVLARAGSAPRVRLRHLLLFGAVSVSLPLAWVTRNWLVSGTLLGNRKAAWESPAVALDRTWEVLRLWVWPPTLDRPLFAAAAAGLVVAAAAAGGALLLSRRSSAVPVTRRPMAFTLYLLLYLVFIVLIKLHIGKMEPRYLTPAAVPLALLAAYGLDRCLLRCRGLARWGRPLALAMGVGLSVWWLGHALPGAALSLRFQHDNGYTGYFCYNARLWQSTEVVAMLKQGDLEGTLYTNMPRLTYFYSGRPALRTPTDAAVGDPDRRAGFRRAVAGLLAAADPVYVLYVRNPFFHRLDRNPALPDRLGQLVTLTPRWVARDRSGVLFQVTAVPR